MTFEMGLSDLHLEIFRCFLRMRTGNERVKKQYYIESLDFHFTEKQLHRKAKLYDIQEPL